MRALPLPFRLARGALRRYRHALRVRWSLARNLERLSRVPDRPILLIIRVERIGDLVACEPLAEALSREHPGCAVAWAAKEPHSAVLPLNRGVDMVLPVECLGEAYRLARARPFARVANMHFAGSSCPICREPVSDGGFAPEISQADYYRHGNLLEIFSKLAGVAPPTRSPALDLPTRASASVDRLKLPADTIVMAPYSNERSRNWPKERVEELVEIASVSIPGFRFAVIGEERDRSESLPDRVVDLRGSLDIAETAEVIRRARLFLGVDSAPSHIANAVGAEAVILLGDYGQFWSRFGTYMPFSGDFADGKRATILRASAGGCREISAESALREIERRLARQ